MNKHNFRRTWAILVAVTVVVFLGQGAFGQTGNTAEDQAFNENKDNLTKTYSYMLKFRSERYDDKIIESTNEIRGVMVLAGQTVEALEKGIKDLNAYQQKSEEARKVSLAAKVKLVKGDLPEVEKRLQTAKTATIKKAEKRLGWIERATEPAKAEGYYQEMKDIFTTLAMAFPNDAEVEAAKAKMLPDAEKKVNQLGIKTNASAAEYRMPKELYTASDTKAVREKIAGTFKDQLGTEALRIVIANKEWTTKEEKEWKNDKWEVRTYYLIKAFIAAQDPKDKSYYVWEQLIRKDGEFIKIFGTVDKYRILQENINK